MISISPHTEENRGYKILKSKNIISSVGHSSASYEDVAKAVSFGLSHATHTYNGMKGLLTENPVLLGQFLILMKFMQKSFLIKIHVHPEAVRTLIKIKGVDKVICHN